MREKQLANKYSTTSISVTRSVSAWETGGAALIVSAVICLVILAIAKLAGGNMIVAPGGGQTMTVGVGSILVALLVTVTVGTILLATIGKQHPARWRLMAGVGLVVAILSIAAPLFADAAVGTKLALSTMHIATGLAWFVMVRHKAHHAVVHS